MSENLQTVEAPNPGGDHAAFASEFQRLARAERSGEASAPSRDDPERRHETSLEEKPAGQGGEAAPPVEAAPPEPAPRQDTDEIWANAPEALRTAYFAEKTAREKAENAVRTGNGRASKAEREAAALRAQVLARTTAPAATPAAVQDDPELRERLLGDYGEAIEPVVNEVLQLRQTVARLEATSASAESQQQARQELELAEYLAGEEAKLTEAHGDWATVVREPDFVQWVQDGPQMIRDGIARNGNGIVNADEAAKILDLFKVETGRLAMDDPLVAKRRRQLDGSRIIPARGAPGGPTATGTPNDFSSAWAALRAADEAKARRRNH